MQTTQPPPLPLYMNGALRQPFNSPNGTDGVRPGGAKKPKKIKDADIDYQRLCTSMRRARLSTREYRQERLMAVKQYVGTHWSEESVRETVPLNLINIYAQIVLRNLVSHNPRVMLSTFDKDIKPAVSAMEEWCNQEMKKMGFATMLQEVALDALFSIGIVKVALASGVDAASNNWASQGGQPFAERVDFDDFVFDIHAQSFRECTYIGHRMRVPLEAVQSDPNYSDAKYSLTATPQRLYNQEGDERINTFGRTTLSGGDAMEFMDHVDLWEVYLPFYRKVVTLSDDGMLGSDSMSEPLRVQEWLGPDCGPYHLLCLELVPGNLMPIGPIMQLVDLHHAVNNCLRKLIRQCQRLKEVTLVTAEGNPDGERIVRASDGDMITVLDPKSVAAVTFGGPNANLFQLMQALQQMFSWAGGNLDVMGGLSPQAKTASQESLLSNNSAKSVQDMQERVINFTSGVQSALMWYWWQHPSQTFEVNHKLPNMPDISLRRKVTPEQRQKMPFANLDIMVDPYSLQHSTPQATITALTGIVQNIIIPLQPLLQQQGIFFDINSFLTKISKYQNIPDLADIVSIIEPPAQEGQPAQGGAGGAAETLPGPKNTNREYTRHNVSERTSQGDAADNVNRMLGQSNKGGNPNKTAGGGQGAWK